MRTFKSLKHKSRIINQHRIHVGDKSKQNNHKMLVESIQEMLVHE